MNLEYTEILSLFAIALSATTLAYLIAARRQAATLQRAKDDQNAMPDHTIQHDTESALHTSANGGSAYRLTPSEILHHLGLQVPEEGIFIEPHDAFYFASALHLLGKTMSVAAISDDDLHSRHASLLGIGEFGLPVDSANSREHAEMSRANIRVALQHRFGVHL